MCKLSIVYICGLITKYFLSCLDYLNLQRIKSASTQDLRRVMSSSLTPSSGGPPLTVLARHWPPQAPPQPPPTLPNSLFNYDLEALKDSDNGNQLTHLERTGTSYASRISWFPTANSCWLLFRRHHINIHFIFLNRTAVDYAFRRQHRRDQVILTKWTADYSLREHHRSDQLTPPERSADYLWSISWAPAGR